MDARDRHRPQRLGGGWIAPRRREPAPESGAGSFVPGFSRAGPRGRPASSLPPTPSSTRLHCLRSPSCASAPLREQAPRATVQVRFRVNADGTTEAFTIIRSTDTRYDAASIEALRHLRFVSGKVDGRTVAVWMELPIQW
ncbi:MAG TPA: TonB family protein [Longimicrobium sp.]